MKSTNDETDLRSVRAAICIQSYRRRLLAIRFVAHVRTVRRNHATMIIQKYWRGYKARSIFKQIVSMARVRRNHATMIIQKYWRCYKARSNFKKIVSMAQRLSAMHMREHEFNLQLRLEKLESKVEKQGLKYKKLLLHDTYSFIMVDPWSFASILAWVVFLIQIGCFFLVISEFFLNSHMKFQPEPFPKGVDQNVHAGQGIVILLVLLVLGALWESTSALNEGFDEDIKKHGIKYEWWVLSHSMRLFEGIVATSATFILVLFSDNILDLFKDFTAITFVSSFDNIVYTFADMNVFGPVIQKTVEKCNMVTKVVGQNIQSSVSSNSDSRFNWVCFRRFLLHPLSFGFILLVTMYTAWVEFIVLPQMNGKFLCQKIYLQLDDDVNYQLSFFSGSYKILEGNDKRGWYPAYREYNAYEKKNPLLERNMILRFCDDINSWVFTLERDNFDEECAEANYLVESPIVKTQQKYDLFDVSKVDWIVKDLNNDKWRPLSNLVIECEDEGPKYDISQNQTCTSLVVDEREGPFISTRLWSTDFTTIMGKDSRYTTVYNHPVYTNVETHNGQEKELIIFLGKRWAMMSMNDLYDYDEMKSMDNGIDLSSYFAKNFHARWSDYKVAFFSEPVTTDSTNDKFNPAGLSWVMASPKLNRTRQYAEDKRQKNSIFLCGICNKETNPCFYEGICLENSCHCRVGSTGTLCQVLPTRDGYCDEYFNEREYDFDGGDCCEHSCVSSPTSKCGRDESGLFYVGYDSCKADTCTDCWRPSLPAPNLKDVIVTYLSLSSSGRVLALIESVGKSARVYDNDGSRWIMRGSAIMSIEDPSSSTIEVMGRADILNTEETSSPITVVIKTNERIHVFDWNNTLWSEHDTRIFNNISSSPTHLELKNDGNSLGVLYNNGSFILFERDHLSFPWYVSLKWNSIVNSKFVSLSQDATKVVLSNDNCVEMHDIPNNVINTECNLQSTKQIKQLVLSPNGHKLGILFEGGSQGEVVIFHVENNTFVENGNELRGIMVENAKIELSNDGTTIVSYSDVTEVVEFHQYLKGSWQMTDSMPSKSMALSSNQQVMATISPSTGYASIFHRNMFCEDGFSNIRMTFITDNRPGELKWELLMITVSGIMSVLKKGGPYDTTQSMIIEDLCVDDDIVNNRTNNNTSCIGLRIVDLGLDGLKSPGKIGLSINGKIIFMRNETDGYDNIYRVVGSTNCMKLVEKDSPWSKKYDPLLHTECLTAECEWGRIGIVNRSFDNDMDPYLHSFVSMSADGIVVAVGDRRQNQVEIFRNSRDGVLIPYVLNVTSQNKDDDFGCSTSLSADGSIIAIGALGSFSGSGQVYLYINNGSGNNWSLYGKVINAPQAGIKLGFSVSVSADGTVVAASTYDHTCAACIYELSSVNNEWVQRGGCLCNERFDRKNYVKLSSTGSVVVIAYPDLINYTGLVKVYEYNSLTNDWEQLGNDIKGDTVGHNLGYSISISSDGSVLAVAGMTLFPARTYVFNMHENKWQQRGQNIIISAANAFNFYGASLSSDGSIWVISNLDTVRVLKYDETTNEWKDSHTSFPTVNNSDTFSIIESSADMLTVATKGDNTIDIYHLTKKSRTNVTCDGYLFDFTIQPDSFPKDISWFLQDQTGETVIGGKLPTDRINHQNVFKYKRCLSNKNTSFLFYIEDKYGDGICCDWGIGHFTVKWNSRKIMDERLFKSNKHVCLPRSSNLVFMSLNVSSLHRKNMYNFPIPNDLLVSDSNGNVLVSRWGYGDADKNETYHQCVPRDECISIALFGIAEVSIEHKEFIYEGTTPRDLVIYKIGNCDEPSCRQNHSFFEMYFVTDYLPVEVSFSWHLMQSNNEILMSGGNYTKGKKIHHYQRCFLVPRDECVTLMLYHSSVLSGGIILGGFYDLNVSWNDTVVSKGTKYIYQHLKIQMGNCECAQDQSLFEIFFARNQYFAWEILDAMHNVLIAGGNYTQPSEIYHNQGCVSVHSDDCAILRLYDRGDYIIGTEYRVLWNGYEIEDAILVGPFDIIPLGKCTEGLSCPLNYSLFEMTIQTDAYHAEFSWEILDSNKSVLYNAKDYAKKNTEYRHRGCVAVPKHKCATVMLYDSYGDGGTYYDISWNGIGFAKGTHGDAILELKICDCPQNQSLFEFFWAANQHFAWEILDATNNSLVTEGNYAKPSEPYYFQGCVSVQSEDCAILRLYGISDYIRGTEYRVSWNGYEIEDVILVGSIDIIPLENCSTRLPCPLNYSLFEMTIQTDENPEEFSWKLLDEKYTTIFHGIDYTQSMIVYRYRGCVAASKNDCETLELYDNYGDGGTHFDISWNSNTIANGTQEGHYQEFQMGSCDEDNKFL